MIWVIVIAVIAVLGFVVYQTRKSAVSAIKADAGVLVAEVEKVIAPAQATASKELAAAIAAVKKHL